ncbi:MAG: hypothetical protein ACRDMJ_07720 [Solirubrobacteraceae bacterium]
MSATAAHPQKRRRCHHGLAAHVVLCSLALAACGESAGGGGSVGATTATGYSSPIGLSRCMRSHGVPGFPDPSVGPNAGANQGTDVHPQSPAFKHAASICGAGGFSVSG